MSSTGKPRSARRARMTEPTCPVAPNTPILMGPRIGRLGRQAAHRPLSGALPGGNGLTVGGIRALPAAVGAPARGAVIHRVGGDVRDRSLLHDEGEVIPVLGHTGD